MDITLVASALGLPEGAEDTAILSKIAELRSQCGDEGAEEDKESPEVKLIKAGQHPNCSMGSDGSITVTLEYPVTIGKLTTNELVLRRPKMRDLRKTGDKTSNPTAWTATMIASLSGQADRLIDDLDGQDVAVLSQVVGFLLSRRPRTGQ